MEMMQKQQKGKRRQYKINLVSEEHVHNEEPVMSKNKLKEESRLKKEEALLI